MVSLRSERLTIYVPVGWMGGYCPIFCQYYCTSRVSFGGRGICPLGYVENFILHVNQLFNDTINVCAKTVPDSTKLRLIKGPKSKFPRGSKPPNPPSLPHACTQICACPPIIHTISFCPPSPMGKKLKETLTWITLGC